MSKIPSGPELSTASRTPRSKARIVSRKAVKLSASFAEGNEVPGTRRARTFENRSPTTMSKKTQVRI